MAEFNWWLLIVGLVVGAGLTWLVVADTRRREVDVEESELPTEAAWLATAMAEEGDPVSPATAERLIRLHRTYLASSGQIDDEMPPWDEDPSAGDDPVVERDRPEAEPPVRNIG